MAAAPVEYDSPPDLAPTSGDELEVLWVLGTLCVLLLAAAEVCLHLGVFDRPL